MNPTDRRALTDRLTECEAHLDRALALWVNDMSVDRVAREVTLARVSLRSALQVAAQPKTPSTKPPLNFKDSAIALSRVHIADWDKVLSSFHLNANGATLKEVADFLVERGDVRTYPPNTTAPWLEGNAHAPDPIPTPEERDREHALGVAQYRSTVLQEGFPAWGSDGVARPPAAGLDPAKLFGVAVAVCPLRGGPCTCGAIRTSTGDYDRVCGRGDEPPAPRELHAWRRTAGASADHCGVCRLPRLDAPLYCTGEPPSAETKPPVQPIQPEDKDGHVWEWRRGLYFRAWGWTCKGCRTQAGSIVAGTPCLFPHPKPETAPAETKPDRLTLSHLGAQPPLGLHVWVKHPDFPHANPPVLCCRRCGELPKGTTADHERVCDWPPTKPDAPTE